MKNNPVEEWYSKFDSKEIAQRSLLVIEQIEQEKKKKKKRIIGAATSISLCTLMLVGALTFLTPSALEADTMIEDSGVPLGIAPNVEQELCEECEVVPNDECEECE